ncbi:MAG TPA: ribonuclease P protein component [Verrucomicrobia bacterium]|nr:ribonuclease P protein component [Verrucomicrobiota bacterium]
MACTEDSSGSSPRESASRGLPREERMRASSEVRAVLDRGETFVGRHMVLKVLCLSDETSGRRFAVIASKKVGGSVARSRAKRRLRELYRLHRNLLPQRGLRLVFISRYRVVNAPYALIENEFLYLLRKADVLMECRS